MVTDHRDVRLWQRQTYSSHRHTIEDSSTPPLKKKSIAELYTQTKPILKLMSTLNAKRARELALKLMLATSNSTINVK
jgi:hypothetical protein